MNPKANLSRVSLTVSRDTGKQENNGGDLGTRMASLAQAVRQAIPTLFNQREDFVNLHP